MATPYQAAQQLHTGLHASDPRAWNIAQRLQAMAASGDPRATNAMNLLRQVHEEHKAQMHQVQGHPEDGRPIMGYYPFPKTCSAGVCGGQMTDASTILVSGWGDSQKQSRMSRTYTGALLLTPDVILMLKNMMLAAAVSVPKMMGSSAAAWTSYTLADGSVVAVPQVSPQATKVSTPRPLSSAASSYQAAAPAGIPAGMTPAQYAAIQAQTAAARAARLASLAKPTTVAKPPVPPAPGTASKNLIALRMMQ